jgi:hypothetical protein
MSIFFLHANPTKGDPISIYKTESRSNRGLILHKLLNRNAPPTASVHKDQQTNRVCPSISKKNGDSRCGSHLALSLPQSWENLWSMFMVLHPSSRLSIAPSFWRLLQTSPCTIPLPARRTAGASMTSPVSPSASQIRHSSKPCRSRRLGVAKGPAASAQARSRFLYFHDPAPGGMQHGLYDVLHLLDLPVPCIWGLGVIIFFWNGMIIRAFRGIPCGLRHELKTATLPTLCISKLSIYEY